MPKELILEETYAEDIAKLIASFSEKDTVGKQSLTQLQTADPRAFAFAAVRVLGQTERSPGSRCVVHLLEQGKNAAIYFAG